MQTIFITKGLPGSGKSTWAKQTVETNKGRVIRVNKDDIRMMLHAGKYSKENEKAVLAARDELVRQGLWAHRDVIIDDTNLEPKHEEAMRRIAMGRGETKVEIIDFTDVPLETCLENNQKRAIGQGFVPPDVIKGMWRKYIWKAPAPPEYDATLPDAVIVDIDGTVALNKSGRGFYDWQRVGEDAPNKPVIDLVRHFRNTGTHILYVSGRDEACREETQYWIHENIGAALSTTRLWMRPAGDTRDDRIVKREIYDAHIRGNYNVRFVLDDRNKVVDMWRNELGLTVFQVAEGDF